MIKPHWFKTSLSSGKKLALVRSTLRANNLHTVCEEALCPNIGKCFSAGEATFLILGKHCTRNCSFCNVSHGLPETPNISEPSGIVSAVESLGLKYVVITSPTRDDLPDGGAHHYFHVVSRLRGTFGTSLRIEVLVPDFMGKLESVREVLSSRPQVFSHNVETVPRLYPDYRKQASYLRSLSILEEAKVAGKSITKSGIMLGMGETPNEVLNVLGDLRRTGCDIVTIGQYLSPSRLHPPVKSYVPPEIFAELGETASGMGFTAVSSGPLVRSSLDATLLYEKALEKRGREKT